MVARAEPLLHHLWRAAKNGAAANHQYASLEEELDLVVSYLCALPPREVLRKAGILSEDFWLRRELSAL